ncbi:MAG: hypothetical protein P1U53_17995, partial [Sulfitobacter sp.]|nr:hypothetical protein [Sulfitobacter sp.]
MESLNHAVRRVRPRGHYVGAHGAVSPEKHEEVLSGGSFVPSCVETDAEFANSLREMFPNLARLLEFFPKLELTGDAAVAVAHRGGFRVLRADIGGMTLYNNMDQIITKLLEFTGAPLAANLKSDELSVDTGGIKLRFCMAPPHEDAPLVKWTGGELSMNRAGALLLLSGTYVVGPRAPAEELERAASYFRRGYVVSLPGTAPNGNVAMKSGDTILGFRGTHCLGGQAFVSELEMCQLPSGNSPTAPTGPPFIGYA